MYYIIRTVGEGCVTVDTEEELKPYLKSKKALVWVGGVYGIYEDWGRQEERPIDKIIAYENGKEEIIYDRCDPKKK